MKLERLVIYVLSISLSGCETTFNSPFDGQKGWSDINPPRGKAEDWVGWRWVEGNRSKNDCDYRTLPTQDSVSDYVKKSLSTGSVTLRGQVEDNLEDKISANLSVDAKKGINLALSGLKTTAVDFKDLVDCIGRGGSQFINDVAWVDSIGVYINEDTQAILKADAKAGRLFDYAIKDLGFEVNGDWHEKNNISLSGTQLAIARRIAEFSVPWLNAEMYYPNNILKGKRGDFENRTYQLSFYSSRKTLKEELQKRHTKRQDDLYNEYLTNPSRFKYCVIGELKDMAAANDKGSNFVFCPEVKNIVTDTNIDGYGVDAHDITYQGMSPAIYANVFGINAKARAIKVSLDDVKFVYTGGSNDVASLAETDGKFDALIKNWNINWVAE